MHVDTYVVAWLYAGDLTLFPAPTRHLLDSEPLAASPMVALELTYLHEIGRTSTSSDTVLAELGELVGLTISSTPFPRLARVATGLNWTRDPFDRLICAHAIVDDDILLTRDRRIHKHLSRARWIEDA